MELSEQDAGRRCTVRVGDSVTIVLPENPTTGYRWHPDVDTEALAPAEDRYEDPGQSRGAAGTRRLTFVARRPGVTRLHLVKERAWEQTAAEEFEVSLDVQA